MATEGRPRLGSWLRLATLVLVVAAVGVTATLTDVSDLERLRGYLRTSGPLAPAAFVLIYATYSLAPLPRTALSILTGVLFGFWWGIGLAYLGSLLGATTAFWLARALGRDVVTRLSGRRLAAVEAVLARHGFLAVLGARVIPVVPFWSINYAAGVTDIDRRDYWTGTLIGILPGTVFYVAVGAFAMETDSWLGVLSLLAVALLGIGALGWLLLRRRSLPRRRI